MSATSLRDVLGRATVHPFPARMAPCIALDALSSIPRGSLVLDPMSGSGTIAALARARGHRAIGFDVDPLAVLIGSVWVRPLPIQDFLMQVEGVLKRAQRSYARLSVMDPMPDGADAETKAFCRYWFNLDVRRQLLCLSRSISACEDGPMKDAFWCAFSRMIIAKQAGVSRALDLAHSRPHRAFKFAPRKPFDLFAAAAATVAKGCLDANARERGPAARISLGDARKIELPDGSIDLVFTSPPYLNAIDYIRCSKFSLVWMGYSIQELRKVRSQSIGTEVGGSEDPEAEGIVDKLQLRPALSRRMSGILLRYTQDTSRMLTEARRVLKSRGRVILVVGENTVRGTFVPTAKLIELAGSRAGLRVASRKVRALPRNRRYLPPPGDGATGMDNRMQREVVLELRPN